MRRKLLVLTVLTALAALSAAAFIGTGVAVAGKAESEVELEEVNPVDANGVTWKYEGRVHASSKRCRKNREVTIKHKGFVIGTAKTNKRGDFVIVSEALPPPGDKFTVSVEETDDCEGDRATEKIDDFFEPPE
jgi:hypothetical protein